jgi:putative hemolysin
VIGKGSAEERQEQLPCGRCIAATALARASPAAAAPLHAAAKRRGMVGAEKGTRAVQTDEDPRVGAGAACAPMPGRLAEGPRDEEERRALGGAKPEKQGSRTAADSERRRPRRHEVLRAAQPCAAQGRRAARRQTEACGGRLRCVAPRDRCAPKRPTTATLPASELDP